MVTSTKNVPTAPLSRNLPYYRNFPTDTQAMEMSWGPCLEPSYQFFGQCLDKVTKVRLKLISLIDFIGFYSLWTWRPHLSFWLNVSVFQKSRDPSPLLPFWDKCRNLMRGSFELRSQVFVMKALGEREPLKNSEYLSLCSNGFTFKWTNGWPFLEYLATLRYFSSTDNLN